MPFTYKVFHSLGSHISSQFKGDPSNIFTTNVHVKVDCVTHRKTCNAMPLDGPFHDGKRQAKATIVDSVPLGFAIKWLDREKALLEVAA